MSSSAILKKAKAVALTAFLADSGRAQLDFEQPVIKGSTSTAASSNKFDAESLRASCKCDLTGGACDYACCCDKDCPAATISAWQDNGACKANQGGVDGCKAETGAASLADINALSSVFGDAGQKILCTQASNKGDEGNMFQPIAPKNLAELEDYLAPEDQFNLQSEEQQQFGYQPYEDLAGPASQNGGKVYLNLPGMYGRCQEHTTAKFMDNVATQECMFKKVVLAEMDQALCDQLSASNIIKDKIYKGDAQLPNLGTEIVVKPSSTQKKFRMGDLKETPFEPPSDPEQFKQSTFSGNSCDDFVLETHYKVYYTEVDPAKPTVAAPVVPDVVVPPPDVPVVPDAVVPDGGSPPVPPPDNGSARLLQATEPEQTPNSYFIEKVEVDVVYGQIGFATSAEGGFLIGNSKGERTFKLKSSMTFLEREGSRLQSGALGYATDAPIMVGQIEKQKKTETDSDGVVTTTEKDAIKFNVNGFALKGADHNGKCMFVDERLKPAKSEKFSEKNYPGLESGTVAKADMTDITENMYLDDPVLSYVNSMVYGCSLEFTYDELKDFCKESEKWTYLALFQNMYQLDKIGTSGNADPHYVQDWITAVQDSSQDQWSKNQSDFSEDGTCTFPSVHVVEMFTQKIGLREDPQGMIMQLYHYQANLNSNWKFTLPDRTQKQKFDAKVVIKTCPVDQDINLFVGDFVPGQASSMFTLSRNILYPFYVYGEVEENALQ